MSCSPFNGPAALRVPGLRLTCGMLHRPSIREGYSRRPTCLMNVGEVIVGDDAKAVGRAAAKEPLSVYQRVWPIFGCGVRATSVVADREATEAERARLTTRCNRCNISTSVHGRRSWNRRPLLSWGTWPSEVVWRRIPC